ncbi:MAG: ferric reductase [Hyphomicrobiaceae bacterium]|nr:ferric reductase [Hyphomicrobiaceae bacterium]
MRLGRAILIWSVLVGAVAGPIVAAASSPLLAWRDPIYVSAGFAGVGALGVLLIQPLLIGGYLPGLSAYHRRRVHRWIGGLLVVAVVIHVSGLWFTSPPDVVDALLFASPTPFSAWGVIAMWAIFSAALWAAARRWLRLSPRLWRIGHTFLAIVIVVGSVVHCILVEGTMETLSKAVLCALVVAATMKVIVDMRVWSRRKSAG